MFYYETTGLGYYQTSNPAETRHTVRVVTPPVTEPVTIQEAKAQLNIGASDTSHDSELVAIIAAAREEWERDTSIALITRTLEHRIPTWQDVITLSVRPVIAIVSVKYIDEDGIEQTVSTSDYYLDIDQIQFKASFVQPGLEERSEAIRVTYTAGHGMTSSDCPELDRMAIKLNLANRFEDRDMINGGASERRAYESLVAKKMRASYP